MAKYRVRLNSRPKRRDVPPLLRAFSKWLGEQQYGSVGLFELDSAMAANVTSMPERDAWCFARLCDGSRLILLDALKPAAVLRVSSASAPSLISGALDDFLWALAEGTTRIAELDHGESSVRGELATWLRLRRVKRKSRRAVELNGYLKRQRVARASSKQSCAPQLGNADFRHAA